MAKAKRDKPVQQMRILEMYLMYKHTKLSRVFQQRSVQGQSVQSMFKISDQDQSKTE